eukprot:gene25764-11427_t
MFHSQPRASPWFHSQPEPAPATSQPTSPRLRALAGPGPSRHTTNLFFTCKMSKLAPSQVRDVPTASPEPAPGSDSQPEPAPATSQPQPAPDSGPWPALAPGPGRAGSEPGSASYQLNQGLPGGIFCFYHHIPARWLHLPPSFSFVRFSSNEADKTNIWTPCSFCGISGSTPGGIGICSVCLQQQTQLKNAPARPDLLLPTAMSRQNESESLPAPETCSSRPFPLKIEEQEEQQEQFKASEQYYWQANKNLPLGHTAQQGYGPSSSVVVNMASPFPDLSGAGLSQQNTRGSAGLPVSTSGTNFFHPEMGMQMYGGMTTAMADAGRKLQLEAQEATDVFNQPAPGVNVVRLVDEEPMLLKADIPHTLENIRRLMGPAVDAVRVLVTQPNMVLDMNAAGMESAIDVEGSPNVRQELPSTEASRALKLA